ncbi:LytTr DNA-binding domain-containing protein [Tenacibaculum adriaticum]|uniref:LytTr DNA-binding domain-containing protein n=1 Tax=Tenacibaculum adriaticum TaxID=413713 RepID=A0A5S5DTS8_9FLAO|nr:LytTR family transcriptional regulator [Tenacibaculum adriaticum]TYP99287.1 LytTr DNA-binding domain-containing protein [Tenacibaculum adriaticum]
MKKDKLYFFTFLSLLFIVYAIGYFNMNYFVDISTEQFLKIQIESSKREAKEISSMISSQISSNINEKEVIKNIQKSIENTDNETGFICMYDWSGKEICHPNIDRVGKYSLPEESFISTIDDNTNSKDFYHYLKNKKEGGGIRTFKEQNRSSEIIYVFPVKNTDWIIAAHANTQKIKKQINNLKKNFITVYVITGTLIVLLSLLMVRLIGSRYEKKLELKNEKLSNEVLNLSKLNHDLIKYKSKVKTNEIQDKIIEKRNNKQRILTYSKNELVPLLIEQIAYIYTKNTITYIVCLDGKKSNTNSSLDEIYSSLDETFFFRANRQYILSINAIDKILRYGNNQLKIEVLPEDPIDIIISKNKASEFKVWLNN